MKEHKQEPFGLMGGIRCAACDETWPCEVSRLRGVLRWIEDHSNDPGVIERIRKELKQSENL